MWPRAVVQRVPDPGQGCRPFSRRSISLFGSAPKEPDGAFQTSRADLYISQDLSGCDLSVPLHVVKSGTLRQDRSRPLQMAVNLRSFTGPTSAHAKPVQRRAGCNCEEMYSYMLRSLFTVLLLTRLYSMAKPCPSPCGIPSVLQAGSGWPTLLRCVTVDALHRRNLATTSAQKHSHLGGTEAPVAKP